MEETFDVKIDRLVYGGDGLAGWGMAGQSLSLSLSQVKLFESK